MELARFLEEHGGGLPLMVAELINTLWDEGVLVARDVRSWRLASPLDAVQLPGSEGEEAAVLILRRLRRLPNSTRRLAALAAVIGQHFEADLLQRAAEEHPGVVEIGLEILLKRWLVRQYVPQWANGRRERDIVLWTQGARRGMFEFAHRHVRNALYQDLNPLRRQAMHGQVAAALEESRPERRERLCEALAFHYRAAGEWEKALPHLERAAEKAHAFAARSMALHYCDLALEGLSRLVASSRNDDQAERWGEERQRLRGMRERIAAG
jgi:predicted ATPase